MTYSPRPYSAPPHTTPAPSAHIPLPLPRSSPPAG